MDLARAYLADALLDVEQGVLHINLGEVDPSTPLGFDGRRFTASIPLSQIEDTTDPENPFVAFPAAEPEPEPEG